MIGNDIVDFRKSFLESNWLRRGYLDKLFCLNEQRMILASPDPNQMVWLLWSMKESSYKAHFRQFLIRTYQPKNIACSNLHINECSASGEIHYGDQRYFSRSILTADFIHTSVVMHSRVFNSLRVLIANENVASLSDNYRALLNANSLSGYRVIKNELNIPYLLNERTGQSRPLSLSHHGRFLSLVFISNYFS